ncbi:MAG: fumarate hydratase C-terminal domain-containing protein, partial [Candidatus Marinimicrobia bacterium]|nr:fumarate hydratase C-terminal domain-containing protein [Candidatus Neomarinimicrobiota bacterium]
LKDGAIYHCGPIMVYDGKQWVCRAAGPTTSIREERYQSDVIREYGIRCVIGKGGMGKRTAQALRTFSAVYLSAVGGAAVIYANSVQSVETVYQLDAFGIPEAMWVLQVKDFPAIVTMDANGNSLHEKIMAKSKEMFNH